MPTDLDLLRRYRATRDEDAFARLASRHAAAVRQAALRSTGDAAAAVILSASLLTLGGVGGTLLYAGGAGTGTVAVTEPGGSLPSSADVKPFDAHFLTVGVPLPTEATVTKSRSDSLFSEGAPQEHGDQVNVDEHFSVRLISRRSYNNDDKLVGPAAARRAAALFIEQKLRF
jgi:hypothetical protein